MSIHTETFCIYCQRDYVSHARLRKHVLKAHPNTYAATALLATKASQPATK